MSFASHLLFVMFVVSCGPSPRAAAPARAPEHVITPTSLGPFDIRTCWTPETMAVLFPGSIAEVSPVGSTRVVPEPHVTVTLMRDNREIFVVLFLGGTLMSGTVMDPSFVTPGGLHVGDTRRAVDARGGCEMAFNTFSLKCDRDGERDLRYFFATEIENTPPDARVTAIEWNATPEPDHEQCVGKPGDWSWGPHQT